MIEIAMHLDLNFTLRMNQKRSQKPNIFMPLAHAHILVPRPLKLPDHSKFRGYGPAVVPSLRSGRYSLRPSDL